MANLVKLEPALEEAIDTGNLVSLIRPIALSLAAALAYTYLHVVLFMPRAQ
jgi:hypothetical protein